MGVTEIAKGPAPGAIIKGTRLFPLGRSVEPEKSDVVHERRVIEPGSKSVELDESGRQQNSESSCPSLPPSLPRVDDDGADVKLLVSERLRRCAHVVLAQADFQDVADCPNERKAAIVKFDVASLRLDL